MNLCLLCQSEGQSDMTFWQLLLLKSPRDGACENCLASFEEIEEMHCPTCYKPGSEMTCQDCLYWQAQGQEVSHVSLYRYNEAMKAYFSRYKFEGDYQLRHLFAQDIKAFFKKHYSDYQVIPIPLGQRRLEERGFNQVTGWLDSAGLPYQEILGKQDIAKQSEKSRQERRQLAQPFYIKKKGKLREKILLIDDIYTTGSTLQLARQLLQEQGIKEVKTLSLAR